MSTPAEKKGIEVGDWVRFVPPSDFLSEDETEAMLTYDDGTSDPHFRDKQGFAHYFPLSHVEKIEPDPDYFVTPEKDSAVVDEHDPVNHPSHYTQGGIECIEAIRAALTDEEFRGYCKGNALKYTWRERHKGGDESLGKALWYLRESRGENER